MKDKLEILLVEDELLIAENMRITLEELGYDVVGVCNSFEETIDFFSNYAFDIALFDINLGPGHDKGGLELASILSKTSRKPFIFLTAYNDFETIKSAAALKPSNYLIKPVNPASIFAAIQTAIENFSNHLEPQNPIESDEKPPYFFNKNGNKIVKIFWKDIFIMESIKNYVRIKTFHNPTEYLIRGSLQQVQNFMIPPYLKSIFGKASRSILINVNAIQGFRGDEIITAQGSISSSKAYIKELCK